MHRSLTRAAQRGGAAFVAIIAAPAAAEEDLDREYLPTEIVVTAEIDEYTLDDGSTATKTPTPLIDVPQTVAFITEDQLEDQSIRQLGEALRYVPGISLETGEGHRDEVFIRGQETTADFFLDGLRDDAQYYRSLYNIQRIEVLKGANALIFGRGGGGGVINRVSKTPSFDRDITQLDASVSTFGAFALTGDIGRSLNDSTAARIVSTYEEFANDRDVYEGRFFGIAPTVAFQLAPETQLIASYSYDDDRRVVDRGAPSDGSGPLEGFDKTFFGDAEFNQTRAKTHIAKLRLDHGFSENLQANATVQFADYAKAYANILPRGLVNGGTDVQFSGYRDTQDRQNWIAQANLVWDISTGPLDHTILAGVEASWQDSVNGRANALFPDTDNDGVRESRFTAPLATRFSFPQIRLSTPVRDRRSELTVYSAYLQDQIAIGDHIELIAGLRWDRFDLQTVEALTSTRGDRVDEKFSPRFGVVIKPASAISLYASYTESFLPQAGDQFFLLSPGDAAFEPEKFTNYEIGAKWAPNASLLVSGAVFQLERTNTKGPDPTNPTLTALVGESRTEGFEFNVVGTITPNWRANIGYTYLDGEVRSTSAFGPAGQRLQQLPKHQITAWTRYDFTSRFGAGFGAVYQDEQFTSFSNAVTLPDYLRVDAALFYEVSDTVALQVNVENLFDADYFPSAHGDNNIQPGTPFSARFGVRIEM